METSRFLINRNKKRQLFRLIIMSFMLVFCSGCASMLRIDGPYEGKVIDAETKQPIEGAVVHGSWFKRDLLGYGEYYDSHEVLTDKYGEFKIPGKGLLVLSKIESMGVTIFKAGYEERPENGMWRGSATRCDRDLPTLRPY